jgi:hypothetical protein
MNAAKPRRLAKSVRAADRKLETIPVDDIAAQELLAIFARIRDPEIRELAIMMTRELAEAAEKLGFDRPAPN